MNDRDRSIVGDLINFRGLVYAPINENGVIFLFGKILDDLHMYIEEIKPGFPDCVARRFAGKGWEKVSIEFEYLSSHFRDHKHDYEKCDIIVCWEHDWKDCPLEVIELKSEIANLENWPIKPPNARIEPGSGGEKALLQIFHNQKTRKDVQEWYKRLEQDLKSWNNEIWFNIKSIYIGVYSPERAFVSIKIMKESIQVECFSRSKPFPGTKTSNNKLSPRWAKFTIKSAKELIGVLKILRQSHERIKEAIHDGESVSYFSQPTKPEMPVVS